MKLTRIAVDNPVFATMMMVALLVLGLFSYRQLGVDQFPNIDFPVVVVDHAAIPAPRPRRSKARSAARSRRRSTPSPASRRSPRARSKASRSSSPSSSSRCRRRCALQDVREKVQQVRAGLQAGGQGAADPALRPRRPADRVDRRALRHPLSCAISRRSADQFIVKRLQTVRDVGSATHRRRRQAPDQHRARSRPHAFAARRRQRRHEGGARREPELPRRRRPARQRGPPGPGRRPHRRTRAASPT